MSNPVVIFAAAVVLGLGFLTLRPLLLRLAGGLARREQSRPIPQRWLDILQQQVPAAQHLDQSQRVELLRAGRELMETRHWEGCGGLSLTDDMKLVVAAQACLLTVGIPGEAFPGLREVLVYPSTFVGRRVCDPRAWLNANEPSREVPELGEAWTNGIIVISWEAVIRGAADPHDGKNVVLHEFAHELAAEHQLVPRAVGSADYPPSVADPEAWERILREALEELSYKVDRHTASALDPYGATNPAEFFAVATETFFEKPGALKEEYPALYGQLQSFFQQDPAALVVPAG